MRRALIIQACIAALSALHMACGHRSSQTVCDVVNQSLFTGHKVRINGLLSGGMPHGFGLLDTSSRPNCSAHPGDRFAWPALLLLDIRSQALLDHLGGRQRIESEPVTITGNIEARWPAFSITLTDQLRISTGYESNSKYILWATGIRRNKGQR